MNYLVNLSSLFLERQFEFSILNPLSFVVVQVKDGWAAKPCSMSLQQQHYRRSGAGGVQEGGLVSWVVMMLAT
jgi:hypothetical protein